MVGSVSFTGIFVDMLCSQVLRGGGSGGVSGMTLSKPEGRGGHPAPQAGVTVAAVRRQAGGVAGSRSPVW